MLFLNKDISTYNKTKAKAKAKFDFKRKKMSVQPLLRSAEYITIIQVRGKYVISSIPQEQIFGRENTLLECYKCMRDATWRGVLVGPCVECATLYEGYATGFFEKEYPHSMPCGSSSAPFGFYCGLGREVCRQIDALMERNPALANIPLDPPPIAHDYAYSFYGVAALGNYTNDTHSLLDSKWGQGNINRRYSCDSSTGDDESPDPRWMSITTLWSQLQYEFDPHSRDFFKKCERMEKEWTECIMATTQAEVDSEMAQKKVRKHQQRIDECYFCRKVTAVKACGGCKAVRYCSIGCQHRDWTIGGAYICAGGQLSDPHKTQCGYLAGLRKQQEEYRNRMDIEYPEMQEEVEAMDESEVMDAQYAQDAMDEQYAMDESEAMDD